jgi:hypothetical protein
MTPVKSGVPVRQVAFHMCRMLKLVISFGLESILLSEASTPSPCFTPVNFTLVLLEGPLPIYTIL